VEVAPKYQIYYSLDSANMTSDTSLLPFSLNKPTLSMSVGAIFNDLSTLPGDPKNYITIERSDKSVILLRSYYKVFDLIGYMGGTIYGVFILFVFIKHLSKVEFELYFMSEYLRKAKYKIGSFHSLLSQVVYGILKNTILRPEWVI